MVLLWFGANNKSDAIGIVPNGSHTFSPIHNVFVSRDDLAIAITGLVVFVGLTLLLHYTRSAFACAQRRGEPAPDRARRRERRPGEHGLVDAVERARRDRGRVAHAGVRGAGRTATSTRW